MNNFIFFSQTPTYLIFWILFFGFITGASLGSFLANTGVRLAGYYYGKFRERQRKWQDIFLAASRCNHCQKPLRPWQLVPVFSWFFLKGKCVFCQKKIALFYPLTEFIWGLVGTYLAILLFQKIITPWQALYIILLLKILTLLAIIDFLKLHIPDIFLLILFIMVFPLWLNNILFTEGSLLVDLVAKRGFGVIWAIPFLAIYLITPSKIGFGDVKFIFVFGLMLSLKETVLTIQFAAVIGIISAIVLSLKTGKPIRKIKLAMVSCIITGALIAFPLSDMVFSLIISLRN